jgi:hypothetical protein
VDRAQLAMGRYLERHAEPEARLAEAVDRDFGHVIAVPVYDECDSFPALLRTVAAGPLGPTLLIAVVNARDDSAQGVIGRNERLIDLIEEAMPEAQRLDARAQLLDAPFGALLVIDRSSHEPLPAREGVGLARKIAGDVATALHANERLRDRWIHFTDADALLPGDYLERPKADATVGATYPFSHCGDATASTANQHAAVLYEMYLRQYVIGLQHAGSPYAHHTIGSTMAVDATAYARVRGVPRRHGAEDFYLLTKLAKLGAIDRLGGDSIQLRARASRRIPFGTGPAIRRIVEADTPERSHPFHHPECFRYLALLLAAFGDAAADLAPAAASEGLDGDLARGLADHVGLARLLAESQSRSHDPITRLRDLHTRFDAQRTLKAMHWMRDRGLAGIPWHEALPRLIEAPTAADPLTALRQLVELEANSCGGTSGLAAASLASRAARSRRKSSPA